MNAPGAGLSYRAAGTEMKDTRKNKYDKISSRVLNNLNHSSISNENEMSNNRYKYNPA